MDRRYLTPQFRDRDWSGGGGGGGYSAPEPSMAEAEEAFDSLKLELAELVRERVRFRRDLEKAVADGERMFEEEARAA